MGAALQASAQEARECYNWFNWFNSHYVEAVDVWARECYKEGNTNAATHLGGLCAGRASRSVSRTCMHHQHVAWSQTCAKVHGSSHIHKNNTCSLQGVSQKQAGHNSLAEQAVP